MNHFPSAKIRRIAGLAALCLLPVLDCSCSQPQRVARQLELANRHREAGEFEKAEIEYKNVLQQDAQNVEAISGLGLIYHAQGRDARAAAFLLKARQVQPENLAVRLKLGLIYLASGGMNDARQEALAVLQQNPADPEAPLLLVEASATRDELEDARQTLAALPVPDDQAAPRMVALGNIALRQDRKADAEAAFTAALAANPGFPAGHGAMGILHLNRQEMAAADASLKKAAELSPPRSLIRLHYARFKLQTGDTAAARRVLEEITGTSPDYLPAWVWMAEIAAAEKDFAAAEALVEKTLAREPMMPDALLLSARLRLARGEPGKAIEELERMQAQFPNSAQIDYQLGLAHAAAGDSSKAIARLGQAVAKAPGIPSAALALAEIHLRRNDAIMAIAVLNPVLQQQPNLRRARLLLAEAQRAAGNLDAAAALYVELRNETPRDAQIAFALGLIRLQQENAAEARAEFDQAQEFQPGHPAALEKLIELDWRERQPAAARERLARELARSPESAHLWLLEARISAAQGETARAEEALKKAIELQPDSSTAYYMLAQLYVRADQQDKAIASLRSAAGNNPNNIGPHLLLGLLLEKRSDYAGATEAYEKALTIQPRSILALNNLAYIYAEHTGRPDRALALAQRARVLQPDEPNTADTLGWALLKNAQYAQAVSVLQESTARLPQEPEAHFHLGVAQYMIGNEGAARRSLERALELNPEFNGAEDARQRLVILTLDPHAADGEVRARLEGRLAESPDDPVARLRLASLLRRTGQMDQALVELRVVQQANPMNAAALIGIAEIHAHKKDFPRALEAARNARNAAPDDAGIAHRVGRIAYQAGDHPWAASLLQEAARARPDDPELLIDWAESAYSMGRVAEAAASLARVKHQDVRPAGWAAADTFLEIISLCADPGRVVASATTVENVLRSSPTHGPALMAMALIAEQRGDAALARAHYETLLGHHPHFAPAHRNFTVLVAADPAFDPKTARTINLARQAYPDDVELARAIGILAFRQGEFARALPLLQEFTRKHADDGETLYYVGMAQWRLNQREQGRQSLQRALQLGVSEPHRREANECLSDTKS